MNASETVQLTRLVSSLCPGQKLDQFTPAAWSLVMDDIPYDDAKQAVRTIYRERGNPEEYGARRIEADDIIREVRHIRGRRCQSVDHPIPPAELTQAEEREWFRQAWTAIANGDPPQRDPSELTHEHDPRELTAGRAIQ